MNRTSFRLLLALIPLLTVVSLPRAIAQDSHRMQGRTWRTVEELSPQELRDVDPSTNTARHPQMPYLPAEPYPFTPPYTAEEMGYRVMEFPQRPRWSCIFANVWGSISPEGVLLNPGRSVTFMNYPDSTGAAAEFVRKPGEELYRSLNQNTFPPDAEGSQRMMIRYRTDRDFTKKEEGFMYSPSLRRVRHQVPIRRQDQFPNQAQTLDDATGRDAWEFSWRFVGTDILYQSVRFPGTRPTVIVGNRMDGSLHEVRAADLKLMGNAYPHYTADGGVECYVVEARAREDWLPNYYAPRLLYWLEKTSFYPLRTEQYGRDGNLSLIEVRLTELFNPALGNRGYGPLFVVYWDITGDIMSYMIRDNHRVKQWTSAEQQLFFNPDFMRRQWYLDTSVKSQAGVTHPDQFFLRPALEDGKFPNERPIQLSAEVAARIQAQEAAGRLVFELNQGATAVKTVETQPYTPLPAQAQNATTGNSEGVSETDTHRADTPTPITLR
jgi:hypothetical protein